MCYPNFVRHTYLCETRVSRVKRSWNQQLQSFSRRAWLLRRVSYLPVDRSENSSLSERRFRRRFWETRVILLLVEAGTYAAREMKKRREHSVQKRDDEKRQNALSVPWRVQKRIKRRVAVDLPIDNGFHLYNSTPRNTLDPFCLLYPCVPRRDAFLPSLPFRMSCNTWRRRTYALSDRWKTDAVSLSVSPLSRHRHWISSERYIQQRFHAIQSAPRDSNGK